MSLAADIAAALPFLREQAESLHQDTFRVLRKTGATTTDPVTQEERPVFATVHSGVMGKLQSGALSPNEVAIPGETVIESALHWHTSVATLGVRPYDEIECTAVGPHGDPDMVGVRVRITGPFLKSLATARRFPVEAVN